MSSSAHAPTPGTDFASRCVAIDLLVLDVDGVLTDGGLTIDDHGVESKRFDVRDGAAIALWQKAGRQTAVLSGRRAFSVERRAEELGISRVVQGVSEKVPAFLALLDETGRTPERACYVGDDLADLGPMRRAGLAACPADAAPEVRAVAHLVCEAPGGRGAVRQVVEVLLKTQGLWDDLVAGHDPPD